MIWEAGQTPRILVNDSGYSRAYDINDKGQVTGYKTVEGNPCAFRYTPDGEIEDLACQVCHCQGGLQDGRMGLWKLRPTFDGAYAAGLAGVVVNVVAIGGALLLLFGYCQLKSR